ncbi:hypothetical protein Dimus_038862 [Dionaea muscipula]
MRENKQVGWSGRRGSSNGREKARPSEAESGSGQGCKGPGQGTLARQGEDPGQAARADRGKVPGRQLGQARREVPGKGSRARIPGSQREGDVLVKAWSVQVRIPKNEGVNAYL